MRIEVRKLVHQDLDGQNTRNIPWYKIAINPARQCPPLAGPHVVFVVSRDHGILKMGE